MGLLLLLRPEIEQDSLSLEVSYPRTPGRSIRATARARGSGIPTGTTITFDVSGANVAGGSDDTDAEGVAIFDYVPTTTGDDVVRAVLGTSASNDLVSVDTSTDRVYRHDGTSGTVLEFFVVAGSPILDGVAYESRSGEVWVGAIDGGIYRVLRYEGFSGTLLETLVLPKQLTGLAAEGGDLVVVYTDGDVVRYNGFSLVENSSINVGADTYGSPTFIDGDLVVPFFDGAGGVSTIKRYAGFSTDLVDSFVVGYSGGVQGVIWDGTNLVSAVDQTGGAGADRIYVHEGFSSTTTSDFASPSSQIRGLAWTASVEVSVPISVSVLGGGGGLRRVLSGEAVHQIVSPRGSSRWPVVDSFERIDSYAGGWKAARGKISLAEFEAHRNDYVAGAEWFVWERGSGRLLYRSELAEPTVGPGSVDISGRGPGALLDKDAPRLLFGKTGGEEWADGGADPYDYDTSKKIGVSVDPEGIVWTIDKDRTFAGGEISRAVFYAEGFDGLSLLSFKLRGKDADYANLEIVLRGRNVGEAGDFAAAATELATWSLGGAGPVNGTILEEEIDGEYDLLELGLRATGAFTAADDVEIRARRLFVGGISDDETTADEVFAEVFDRIGCDVVRVEPSGVPVGPVDHRDGSYTSLLDSIAIRVDYYYRVYYEAGKLVGEALSWGRRRYTVLDPEVPRDLVGLEPFDRVTVAFTYPNGAPGRVSVKAQTLKLPDPNPAPTIRITGKPMGDEEAEIVASTLADRLVLPRWSGSGQAHEVYDESGQRVHANAVDAGDLLYYPVVGAEVRIGEVVGSDKAPMFRFTEGIPFLDRLAAKLGTT